MSVDATDVTVSLDVAQWIGSSRRIYPSLSPFLIAPAGSWPRGQNPMRHPRIPRVYTYKEFQNVRK